MRIRTIKPDFWTHPEILACSIPARVLLASMFNQADDEGRLYDNPLRIGANAFGPQDKVKPTALLIELGAKGRICRYLVADRLCIHVMNFNTHQRIDKPTPSVIPPCPLHDDSTNAPRIAPRLIEEGSRPEGKGSGMEQGMDAKHSPSASVENRGQVPDRWPYFLVELAKTDPRWLKVTVGALRKLSQETDVESVTTALGYAHESKPDIQSTPYGWLRTTALSVHGSRVSA